MYKEFRSFHFRKIITLAVFFLLTQAAGVMTTSARIIYVKANATGTTTGLNWTDAYPKLSDALPMTFPGDTIWVAKGVYYPVLAGSSVTEADRLKSFILPEGVAIYGGFPASGNPGLKDRQPLIHKTVLSGDISMNEARDTDGIIPDGTQLNDNSYHVIVIRNRDSTCVLDGFYINGGHAKSTGSEIDGIWTNSGAGMFINRGNPVLRNLVFTGNRALNGNGGGLWSGYNNCSPSLSNVVFTNNKASTGGGMYHYSGAPVLDSVTFNNNEAINSDNNPGNGGGLYIESSDLRITRSLFSGNKAAYGAGIYHEQGNIVITHTTFRSNIAFSFDPSEQMNRGGGGGIHSSGNSPVYRMLIFDRNSAGYAGGMFIENGSPEITNIIFSNNEAYHYGGGFYISSYDPDSKPKVAGLVFIGNKGSGMHNRTTGFKLTQCTFYGNESCGLRNWDDHVEIENCIFWNNEEEINGPGTSQKVTNSLIKGSGGSSNWNTLLGTDGGGNLDTDPLFVNPSAHDLSLRENSPARDAGKNSLLPDFLKKDMAGNDRTYGAHVDMGAYEYHKPAINKITTIPKQQPITIYPNPASGLCQIRTPSPSAIAVYDAGGRVVLNGHSSSPIEISKLADGVYLVVATDPEKAALYTGRLVKKTN